jgi:hypothetical protein
MDKWHTVPNFFPDYEDLSSTDKYHLNEGYSVSYYETKYSGKMYKKIRSDMECTSNAITYLGFSEWWKYWEIKTFLFFKYWGRK